MVIIIDYQSALILFNISKSKNFGEIIRTANALGIGEILVIGRKNFSRYGNFGTYSKTSFRHFYSVDDAVYYLHDNDFKIVGIEINNESVAIESHPFSGNCAFFPGNEGTGLSQAERILCDYFVFIKQYGEGASMNVNVATGIVLHHYAIWSERQGNRIVGQKFIGQDVN